MREAQNCLGHATFAHLRLRKGRPQRFRTHRPHDPTTCDQDEAGGSEVRGREAIGRETTGREAIVREARGRQAIHDPRPNNPGPNDLRPDEPYVLKHSLPMVSITCSGLTFLSTDRQEGCFPFPHVRRSGCRHNHDQKPPQPLRSNLAECSTKACATIAYDMLRSLPISISWRRATNA